VASARFFKFIPIVLRTVRASGYADGAHWIAPIVFQSRLLSRAWSRVPVLFWVLLGILRNVWFLHVVSAHRTITC
jgi:hypothetical protein